MDQHLDKAASGSDSDKRPILVAVDFSSCSRAALLYASHFVSFARAPILVLHVVHDLNNKPGLYRNTQDPGCMRPINDIAADMLTDFVEHVRQSDHGSETLASVRTLLVRGLPAQRIAEIAQRENAALIVMGSRGRSGLSRLTSASVAAQVLKHSDTPVTVVKTPVAGKENAPLSLSSLLWGKRQTAAENSDPQRQLVV